MFKKIMLAAVATLGIAGAAHAEEPCVHPSGGYVAPSTYVAPTTYAPTYRTPVVVNPYTQVRFDRFDHRDDYLRMRERQRWERMRRVRWEREHRYGRSW